MTIKSLVHGFLKTNGSTETLPRPTSEKRGLCESPPAARYAQISGPDLNTGHDGLWHESDLCGHYQFIIVAMILAVSGIAGLISTLLIRTRSFSPAAQLTLRGADPHKPTLAAVNPQ